MESQTKNSSQFPNFPLAELHSHLAPAINPSIYWQIAHEQGFKLPKKDYKEFIKYVTLTKDKKMSINDYFEKIYHPLLDKLSSGTFAVERATYEILAGAYRNNIGLIELRANIMKHNNNGEQDLDHIIMAMLRGMERAFLEYPKLSAGLIFCLAREFSVEQNTVIVEKAIKYHRRGVVAIDFAGPATPTFHYKDYQHLITKAKKAGLKVTAHSGEVEEANDLWEVLEFVNPERIGHGWLSAYDKELMKELKKRGTVLEICPMSNIVTKNHSLEQLKFIFKTLTENKVMFTVNTDWPEMMEGAHLWRQFAMLKEENILSEEELVRCNKIAFEAAFAKKGGLEAYL